MKLTIQFEGQNDPFEGDRTLRLKRLPAGAQVTKALVTVRPLPPFIEEISFIPGAEDWGATKTQGADINSTWVEVDFHARRTLHSVTGTGSGDLQIDMGGAFVTIAQNGTFLPPDEDNAFTVILVSGRHTILPGLTVFRLRLEHETASPNIQTIRVRSFPSNITVRLGQMPPFWARPGEMTETQTGPDFAAVLQNFLAGAEVVDGFYDVPLVIHSDTIARLDVEVEIEYLNQQTVLPEGVPEATLAFDHSSLPKAEANLLQVEVPVGARVVPGETTARVTGAFAESRVVHGPTGQVTPAAAVPVSSGQSQAQPLMLKQDLAATAIDLLLEAKSRFATLNLVLLGDTDGKPANDPLLPRPVAITLDSDVANKPTWLSAALPLEFQFKANTRYWLALQAREGEANWSVEKGPADGVGLQFTADGGLSWRITKASGVTGPLAGFFRLRHTPARFRMPIELQVGSGDKARRVSLERFEPLGRVDFSLDFDEVAEAINQYLDEAAKAQCSEEEHVINGDFGDWSSSGDRILDPHYIPIDGVPLRVLAAPDDRWTYVGGLRNFHFLSPPCNVQADVFGLTTGRTWAMAAHPDGSRLFVLTADIDSTSQTRDILVIDPMTRQIIGTPFNLSPEADNFILSPDGQRLYVMGVTDERGWIQILDVAKLEQALISNEVELADIQIDLFDLDENRLPRDLAITSDGAYLYVAQVNLGDDSGDDSDDEGEISIIEIATHSSETIILVGTNSLQALSLTLDGRNLVVTGSRLLSEEEVGVICIVDTTHKTFVTVPENPNLETYEDPNLGTIRSPTEVAISPDGRRAFVIDDSNNHLLVIDIDKGVLVRAIPLFTNPEDVTVTPKGDRVYVPVTGSEGPSHLASIPIGLELPAEWTLTSGAIQPLCFADPFHRIAVLGLSPLTNELETRATSLSQVVPIVGSCNYEFSFWGLASESGAVLEVIWLGEGCGLRRVDQVPIEVVEFQEEARVEAAVQLQQVQLPFELILHRARLAAPEGSTQAEIRANIPARVGAVIDRVSLRGTQEVVENSDLTFVREEQLANWGLSAADAAKISLTPGNEGTQIVNASPDSVTLAQTIPVVANQPFVLEFRGKIVSQPLRSVNPKVELRWLAADGAIIEPATTLTILPKESEPQSLKGIVPAEASEADLQFILPGRTTLIVQRVSFRPVELVQVPLTFIAQAPGELTISDFRVAYDVAEAPLPPVPPGGLCTPTPPARTPGGQPRSRCFCPCCREEKEMEYPEAGLTAANRPALKGQCPDCGTGLVQPGGRTSNIRASLQPVPVRSPAIRSRSATTRAPIVRPTTRGVPSATRPSAIMPMEAEIAAMLPMSSAEWAALAGPLAAEAPMPPLTVIKGIGEGRSKQLENIGISSLGELAEAAAEDIAKIFTSVSVEQAARFIEAAQKQVESAATKEAPLVSCIMPTHNRRRFVPRAIDYFLRQDYPNRELIIVDDGTDPIKDLVPDDPRIHYSYLDERITLGAKRNLACQEASGAIILHWDDDDWVDYWRVSYQVASLLKNQADICGLNHLLHYDLISNRAWHHVLTQRDRPWVAGSTLCYTEAFWRQNPFPNVNIGEDVHFTQQNPSAKIHPLQAITFQVNMIHPENTSPKTTSGRLWHPHPVEEIQGLLGKDWPFYSQFFHENRQRK